MLDEMKKMPALSLVVQLHGLAAMSFALVFLLEAFGFSFPLVSIQAMHPDFAASTYTSTVSLWVACDIGTFAAYEIFYLPYLFSQRAANLPPDTKLKNIFVIYHLFWCAMITYTSLLPGTSWSAAIPVAVMYGFTLAGYFAPTP